jgi:hypothetical protein
MMHGREKSDSAIVAGKPTNKAVSTAAEPVEPRAEAKGNASQQSTRRTQSRVSVSQALERIRQAVTKNALPSHTQGGSRMPELGPYGSVRGALSNERPYRDLRNVAANYPFERSHRLAGIQPNSGHRDYSRLSCAAGEMPLGPGAAGIFSSVLRRYWPSSGIAVRHELPRFLPIQRCSAGSKTSNPICSLCAGL